MMFGWFRKKPARSYPVLAPGQVAYAVGDLHGRSDLLRNLHRALDHLEQGRTGKPAIEIYLGDYVDRGPDSRGIVDCLIERSRTHSVVALRGNHEAMLLAVLRGQKAILDWLQHGGLAAVASYGVDVAEVDPRDEETFIARLREKIPASHIAFLSGLPTKFRLGPYFFAHAGIRPGVDVSRQRDDDLMWIRDTFLGDERDHGFVVVHGHTPVQEPEFRPNRMNLDTGAYLTGVLTCVRFDDQGPSVLTW
jgi:serine/threonine protein phosphatase 1